MVYKIFLVARAAFVLHARECSSTCRLPLDFPQDRIPHPHAHDALGLTDPREHKISRPSLLDDSAGIINGVLQVRENSLHQI